MALINSFEKSGNWLFRYRGQLPVVLFLTAIPVIWFTSTYGMAPDVMLAITVGAVVISLTGLVVRAIAIATTPKGTSGRNTKGQVAESLNTSGIYSCLRHPLYLGNYMMWIGIVIFTFNVGFTIIVSLAFWLYYERIMFAEEQFLRRKFGDIYDKWSENVSSFIPYSFRFIRPDLPFSIRNVLKREYNSFVNIFVLFALLDLFRNYFLSERIYLTDMWIYLSGASGVIWLIVRTIEKRTKWLEVEGR